MQGLKSLLCRNQAASLNLAVVLSWKLAVGCGHMVPDHPCLVARSVGIQRLTGLCVLNGCLNETIHCVDGGGQLGGLQQRLTGVLLVCSWTCEVQVSHVICTLGVCTGLGVPGVHPQCNVNIPA